MLLAWQVSPKGLDGSILLYPVNLEQNPIVMGLAPIIIYDRKVVLLAKGPTRYGVGLAAE